MKWYNNIIIKSFHIKIANNECIKLIFHSNSNSLVICWLSARVTVAMSSWRHPPSVSTMTVLNCFVIQRFTNGDSWGGVVGGMFRLKKRTTVFWYSPNWRYIIKFNQLDRHESLSNEWRYYIYYMVTLLSRRLKTESLGLDVSTLTSPFLFCKNSKNF